LPSFSLRGFYFIIEFIFLCPI